MMLDARSHAGTRNLAPAEFSGRAATDKESIRWVEKR